MYPKSFLPPRQGHPVDREDCLGLDLLGILASVDIPGVLCLRDSRIRSMSPPDLVSSSVPLMRQQSRVLSRDFALVFPSSWPQ